MKQNICYKLFNLTYLVLLTSAVTSVNTLAHGDDDPVLSMVIIDQFEQRNADGENPLVLEGQGWLGKDFQKLWFKVDAERADNNTEEAELQALYSHTIGKFWDAQIGLRRDFQPSPSRNWAVVGVQGLAPYYFEIDAALFVGDGGRTAFRFEAEYELLFTQRLILSPDIKVNLYAQNDEELGIGSGLSDIEAGLRLRYEIRREFAPYVGVNWSKTFGNSADFARARGQDDDNTQWVVGVRTWF